MAKKQARPGRTLVTFFIGVAIAFGLVALTGAWTPGLGLDLQGGTRITLIATEDPSEENLEEARAIIDQRVNGSGVAEAEVTTEGGDVIAVEIPGENARDLVSVVERQAQLRFRLVACGESATTPCPAPAAGGGAVQPGAEIPVPQGQGQGTGTGQGQGQGQGTGQGDGPATSNRAPVGFGDTTTPPASPEPTPTGTPTDGPTDQATSPAATGTETPTEGETVVPPEDGQTEADVQEELDYVPDEAALTEYARYTCSEDGTLLGEDGQPAVLEDNPNQPLVACSPPEAETATSPPQPSYKYLLTKAVIEGTSIDDASAGIPQGQVAWIVNLDIGNRDGGRDAFTQISQGLVGTERQFAIVLDGAVISAPTMEGTITNGQAQISGNFNEESANNLATSLKFGALPIAFEDDTSVVEVGPSLAGDQLTAGITAGIAGLALVLIYCLVYYRGLGLVVVASLIVAAAVTYAMVLLLSESAGFTLTLPGIAGLIIAVGVTADSFIIFFERIRDEMREGKSMRVAVETGWKRAKVTRLAAQVVSLLSAAVLYIFATGVVKGFGFALGLSTIIDLAILFWFTKPMVSWLATFTFFNSGHKLSGLSEDSLGMRPATSDASVTSSTTGTTTTEKASSSSAGGKA